MDLALGSVLGHVELAHQSEDLLQGLLGGDDDELVGPVVGQDLRHRKGAGGRALLRGTGGGLSFLVLLLGAGVGPARRRGPRGRGVGLEDLGELLRYFRGRGILDRNHVHLLQGPRFVDLLEDALQLLHDGTEVGDDDGAAPLQGIDLAPGCALEWVELVHHVGHVAVANPDDLGDDLVLEGVVLFAAVELRVLPDGGGGLNELVVGADLRHRDVLRLQRRQEGPPDLVAAHWVVGQNLEILASDLLGEDEVLAGYLADRLDELLDVVGSKVEGAPALHGGAALVFELLAQAGHRVLGVLFNVVFLGLLFLVSPHRRYALLGRCLQAFAAPLLELFQSVLGPRHDLDWRGRTLALGPELNFALGDGERQVRPSLELDRGLSAPFFLPFFLWLLSAGPGVGDQEEAGQSQDEEAHVGV